MKKPEGEIKDSVQPAPGHVEGVNITNVEEEAKAMGVSLEPKEKN